jgi:hypothetical protein
MYDHLSSIGDNASLTLVAATLNINATLQDLSFTDGGTHQAFFVLIIRSLFEQLVRFKLRKGSYIVSEQQYAHVLRELRHNLEAYNLLMDICCIPHERSGLFCSSIVKNIINKLKLMKNKEEYTLPIKWDGHAVCLNFVREPDSVAIRIDNLNSGEMNKHKTYPNEDKLSIIIPKIIGEIPLEKLDHNQDYFKSLVNSMKTSLSRQEGIETLYNNGKLKHLDTSRISMMTDQLQEQSKTLKFFIQQAESNCFIKSHEPGFAIRSNDYNIFQQIITILRVYATKLTTKDVLQKRDELEHVLHHYWEKETTINYEKSRQLLKRLEDSRNSKFRRDLDRWQQVTISDLSLEDCRICYTSHYQ